MPLTTHQLIELAQAGASVVNFASQQARQALTLASLAQQGHISKEELIEQLTDLFLGQDVVLLPFDHRFERVLLHYSKLRLRVNENQARRMKVSRAAKISAAARDNPNSMVAITRQVTQDLAEALHAEQGFDQGLFASHSDDEPTAPDE